MLPGESLSTRYNKIFASVFFQGQHHSFYPSLTDPELTCHDKTAQAQPTTILDNKLGMRKGFCTATSPLCPSLSNHPFLIEVCSTALDLNQHCRTLCSIALSQLIIVLCTRLPPPIASHNSNVRNTYRYMISYSGNKHISVVAPAFRQDSSSHVPLFRRPRWSSCIAQSAHLEPSLRNSFVPHYRIPIPRHLYRLSLKTIFVGA